MRTSNLLARNLRWYWRTNLAVLLGVAAAAGVLGGALLVGESVRASLRDIVLARLRNVDTLIGRNGFVREELASAFPGSAPAIVLDATAARDTGGHVAGVEAYGIDRRFWRLQGLSGEPPSGSDAILTPALARDLGVRPGDTLLLRLPKPSAIPLETIHGRKEDAGRTVRLRVAAVTAPEFSLKARQGELKAVYVPLARLQRDLDQAGKVNTILLASAAEPGADPARRLKAHCTLADYGLALRSVENGRVLSLESDSALISGALEQAAGKSAQALGLSTQPVLTYLANTIGLECGPPGRDCPSVPYSLVTALDSELAPAREDGIVLNAWTARELGARTGDGIRLDYFVWKPDGRLTTESARFHVERIVPLQGAAADRSYTPDYPGITESKSFRDWDPPFPLDLGRVRPADELYWDRYRATPKAFVRLERGRRLWGTRFGSLTSVRLSSAATGYDARLLAALDPAAMGLSVVPLRAAAIQAAQGTTDFDEYFLYFSFFLIVSALLLTGLFFRLGIEQRTREIGVLRSLGFPLARIRRLFLLEGAALAIAGAMVGIGVALAYCGLMLLGLRTWWIGAVATRQLSLHASAGGLVAGAAGGVLTGLATVAWTVRTLRKMTPRGLVAGQRQPGRGTWRSVAGAAAALAGIAVGVAAFARKLDQTGGFFGAGTLLLIASLFFVSAWLHRGRFASVAGRTALGLRSMAYRPGRSVLCVALIASATFMIVSLDAFRREGDPAGTGGFPLMAASALPLIYDPNTASGRDALNLGSDTAGVEFVPFRLKPGDDASCLNLYRPLNPRIIAPPGEFLRQAHFAFQDAVSDAANPWLLLEQKQADGAIPAIADANSMTYSLHLKLGDDLLLDGVRYRMVAALRDSTLQGELVISEANFLRLFPDVEGYRFFLMNAQPGQLDRTARELEDSLSDYGFTVERSAARLAAFHRVENTYLSTFRALGGLGLILGTVGLAAVLLRNVLERRRELALLRAVGWRPQHLAAIVLVENVSLLLVGVAAGTACALLAIFPALSARGGHVPLASLATLLGIVLVTGIAASLLATAAALRSPLLEALKAEY
ncbi:MAG: ABC transporter permease [Acidobacteria bacterium]|nr:ABC transporter permease [Acidobacteriota bacterium]